MTIRWVLRRIRKQIVSAAAAVYAVAVLVLVALIMVNQRHKSDITSTLILVGVVAIGMWTGNILTQIVTPQPRTPADDGEAQAHSHKTEEGGAP